MVFSIKHWLSPPHFWSSCHPKHIHPKTIYPHKHQNLKSDGFDQKDIHCIEHSPVLVTQPTHEHTPLAIIDRASMIYTMSFAITTCYSQVVASINSANISSCNHVLHTVLQLEQSYCTFTACISPDHHELHRTNRYHALLHNEHIPLRNTIYVYGYIYFILLLSCLLILAPFVILFNIIYILLDILFSTM